MDERNIVACFIVELWYLNIVTWLMMWFMMNHNSARRRNRQLALRNRTFVRRMVGSAYLDSIIGYDDVQCVNQIRMDRRTFHYLCQMLRDHGRVKLDGVVTMEEQVCMFLHILAHHVKNRTIGSRFCRSGETISRYFNSILHGVLRLQGRLLKVPEPIPNAYPDPKWSWFENCLVEMLSKSVDKLGSVLQAVFGKGVDPKHEIASDLSKMDLSIEDQIKALNILFEKPQNERTFLTLDGAMKKAFVLMLLGQSNRN